MKKLIFRLSVILVLICTHALNGCAHKEKYKFVRAFPKHANPARLSGVKK